MKSEDAFSKLRVQLEAIKEWPMLYMFKFIIPYDVKRYAQVTGLFGDDAEVYHKNSKNGKFTSITAKEVMISADDVMLVYKRASQIPGIIAL
tara:strand:+ start:535 stop:810 length:276 start_codon:yes stop_codon:yes gene_type:complete